MIDERIERLINRRLDGELTADEQLELDKGLIRCPEARAMLEDYQRFDDLARDALLAACSEGGANEPTPKTLWHRQTLWHRHLAGVPRAAIAAAVILVAFLSTYLVPSLKTQDGPPESVMIAAAPRVSEMPALSIEGPRHEKQRIHKDVFGVFDRETQSVYLLEMDRQQTTVVPVSMNY